MPKITNRGFGDRNETIIPMGECKLAQNDQKRLDGDVCKKIKFDHRNKGKIFNPESVLENETHNLLRNFEESKDYLISAS